MNETIIDAIRSYALRLRNFSDQPQGWDENKVKRVLVEPLLKAFNWDTTEPEAVQHEFPVTMGSETKRADYALMSGASPICIVEAKAGDLDVDAAKQALSYARSREVPWAIVTNGRELCLYGREFYKGDNIRSALILEADLSKWENADLVLLAKDTLESPYAAKRFKELNNRQMLREFISMREDELFGAIAVWVEREWEGGILDQEILSDCIREHFGGVRLDDDPPPPPPGLEVTRAGDWTHKPNLGRGIWVLTRDQQKSIDVSRPVKEVVSQLKNLGLRTSTPTAIAGFHCSLKRTAGLI